MHKKPSWATSRGLGFWLIAKRGGINTLADRIRLYGQLVKVQSIYKSCPPQGGLP
ncbi:hypothetical protein [Nostoc sp.]|uniref:hypothetical protein n=1 Tax=Nostoc sp. TaxID=1180 RepID=UPI002FFB8F73